MLIPPKSVVDKGTEANASPPQDVDSDVDAGEDEGVCAARSRKASLSILLSKILEDSSEYSSDDDDAIENSNDNELSLDAFRDSPMTSSPKRCLKIPTSVSHRDVHQNIAV